MTTKDESKTSLGSNGHGFFSQEPLTTTDAYRYAQQVKNLCSKIAQVMAMRGQKSPGQILEGPDYNKDGITTIELCSKIMGAVVSKDEVLSSVADLLTSNQLSADDIQAEPSESYTFKIR